ncbi:GNAT family N-acetyltransferase [Ancylobacter oerskovii]|uniref:GNAT family N-acetyltransferase n=1 Tax=Ancylobacter oerskovii TaxID=459519 RepID=A0ABW4Z0G2_9HYPH|nr:GNAT family N-acetyltransferase [Ancylobacter oerskovii]MBS7542707.1 GNAT family N-acetyltransferase [Ancylobacter oerskovii]
MEVKLRLEKARPEDAEAMLIVHRAAIRGTAAAYYDPDIIDAWAPLPLRPDHIDALARRIESGEEEAIVARGRGGVIVGFGSFVPGGRELRAIYVVPDHGRLGIGAALLRELEIRARKYGLSELIMDATLNAEAFYTRHGFTAVRRGESVLRGGRRMACIRMRKPLKR